MLLARLRIYKRKLGSPVFLALVILIVLFLSLRFIRGGPFLFYVMFEIVLIPMILLIFG